MEQKQQPDPAVVGGLIDCPGPGGPAEHRILSEYLQECWEDKNHRLSRRTTQAAKYKQTKKYRERGEPTQRDE